MNRKVIPALAAIAICLCPSCGKLTGDGGKSHAIRVKVSGVDTKAQVVTTSTLVETLQKFNMSAYVTQAWSRDVLDGTTDDIPAGLYFNDVNGLYFKDVKVLYSDGTQKWTVTGNEDEESPAWSWVNGVPINFFAWAPVSIQGELIFTKADSSVDMNYPFSYATKNGSTGTVTSEDCDDIIFAGVTNTAQYGDEKDRPDVPAEQGYGQDEAGYGNLINGTDTINLHFYHALSQVRFCLSTDDDTYDSSLKLVSARILGTRTSSEGVEPATYAGLKSSGKCVFNYSNTPAVSSGADVSAAFTWSDLAAPCTYSQTFDADFSSGTPKNWTSGSYTPSGASEAKNLFTCTGDVFFIIPQTLSGCKVEITFQQGTDEPFSLVGSFEDVTWLAGKYYTYKIKASKSLELTLVATDWIDGSRNLSL